ncbi:hypothetical protein [Bacteroides acidifaciens]|uniref:hypothetical protein n=1 Tax=Bacteroides acidifaciens TaxID=85831 RepID=UPI00263BE143|nr:hypothetical protein [Bacteroides acidifaciens]
MRFGARLEGVRKEVRTNEKVAEVRRGIDIRTIQTMSLAQLEALNQEKMEAIQRQLRRQFELEQ